MGIARMRGAEGENLAAAYLALIGYDVIARNTNLGGVEVDLVAVDDRVRVVVEVKLRTRTDYGGAALAVDRAKRERLRLAARALAQRAPGPVRVDVIAIEPGDHGLALQHYRNAVTAP